jgi:hypothetical protein
MEDKLYAQPVQSISWRGRQTDFNFPQPTGDYGPSHKKSPASGMAAQDMVAYYEVNRGALG